MTLHVTTFYSFKGGVGRTQALVNAAAWIAMKQRPEPRTRPRVLMVDFDLEASGIQFVEGLTVIEAKPGLVDFIHDYLDHAGAVPDISNYISRAALPNGVPVDVILAGDQARYHSRFGQLRFDALWQRQHGHDLFLDMRHQLDELGYEFMLIDSRTGLCDTSELCTLTLPDQVVLVFAPNRQNLAGTKLVLERIRQNPTTSVLGVASRVRRTDDEHGALRAIMAEFKQLFSAAAGGSRGPSVVESECKSVTVVHEDPQQRVLADAVAVASYSRSALAKEYRRIARRIVARNPRSRFWVSAIAVDARSRERMTRRYGIPSDFIDAWRKIAIQTAQGGDAQSMWNLAAAHPTDRWNSDGRFRRDPERVLDVDPTCAFISLVGFDNTRPPAGAIRWVRESLEFGELERRFFSDASHPFVLREPLLDALHRSISGASLDVQGADAIRVLVWARALEAMVESPAVRSALCDPSNYRNGACFGGFHGQASTSYIMECGDRAGVDWLHLAAECDSEAVRRWVRSAAIDTHRLDIAANLLEPTTAERRYLSHWLVWANDALAIDRAGRGSHGICARSAILGFPGMLDQVRSFWLPGVAEKDVEFDQDGPIGISTTSVMESRGKRPAHGLVLPWIDQSIGGPYAWQIRDVELVNGKSLHSDSDSLDLSYELLTWIALVLPAARVLRAVDEESRALRLEQDALARLDAAGAQEIAGCLTLAATHPVVTRPQMFLSPLHRSAVDLVDLYAALRDTDAAPRDTGVALRVDVGKSVRVVYSRVAPLGSPGRNWRGWEVSGRGDSAVW